MATSDPSPGPRGDEAELFRAFNAELMKTVADNVFESTPQNIEDACAFAWVQFLIHQPDRDRNWQGWLFRTAQRQAWLLERKAQETLPLRAFEWEDRRDTVEAMSSETIELHREVQDALSIIGRLRPRLQRIAMMRALGLRHADISEITGDSRTRTQQLVARASQEIDEVLAERNHAGEHASPRARRLWELETDPPDWMTARIGRVPRPSRRAAGQSVQRRAWRRAAIALDDCRRAAGAAGFDELLAAPIGDADLDRLRQAALRAVENLEHTRSREHRRGFGD